MCFENINGLDRIAYDTLRVGQLHCVHGINDQISKEVRVAEDQGVKEKDISLRTLMHRNKEKHKSILPYT